jgi:hypothetical protein
MQKHELSQMESHIKTIRTAHAALADTSELDELLLIIHRPGWTTPAEVGFVLAALESINVQTAQLNSLRQGLLTAANKVTAGVAAGA